MKITYKNEITGKDKFTDEEIVKKIISSREIGNTDEFLNPKSPLDIKIADFGFAEEVKKAIKILEDIRKKGGKIVVYTDYDADGITGGSILWETLHLLGFETAPYVPHRKLEGYGFSLKGIDQVKKIHNPSLIISVDHGITAREKISYAKSLGISVIVTDHHLKPEKMPDDAKAIFHIPQLSGSGVAYFFAKEIFEHFKDEKNPNYELLSNNFRTEYVSLASIGSIADLVPLTGATRSLVKHGLDFLAKTKRNGLRCILQEAGIEGKQITPYEVGFIIAPRINAVGRLTHAIDALKLLCTTDNQEALTLAKSVGRTNQERQDMVKKALEEAKVMIEKNFPKDKLSNIIVLTSDQWHEGIIGLIASKVADEFYRPVIVMTKSDGFLKGSARSIPAFHITDYLRSLKEYLVDVGGHKQAAGFTISAEKLNNFIKEINRTSKKLLSKKDLERKMEADMKIPLSKISRRLVKLIENLNPFGIGNPQPIFYSTGHVIDAKTFGKQNDHLKIFVGDNDSFPLELIAFSKSADFPKLSRSKPVEVVYQVEIDRWGGNERLRGRLLHWQ